jgi:hypothetical protein
MMEENKTYILYRTPEGQIMIPSGMFGFSSHSLEINGEVIVAIPYGGTVTLPQDTKTIRPATQTRITKAYSNGETTLTVTEYETRLEKAREHRSELPKEYEDACPRYTWDDKEAMFEEHLLTRTYKPIEEVISVFGNYITFSLLDLPQSQYPEIVPIWTTSAKFTDSCILDRKSVFKAAIKISQEKYPDLHIILYEHSMSFSLKSHILEPVTKGNRYIDAYFLASYDTCVKERERIISEIERAFRLAARVDIPVPDRTYGAFLQRFRHIQGNLTKIQSKEKTASDYRDLLTYVRELTEELEKDLGEKEIKEG